MQREHETLQILSPLSRLKEIYIHMVSDAQELLQ